MSDSDQNLNHIETYLTVLYASVSRLAAEFYKNTLSFTETLLYVYVVNSINTEIYKILKNNAQATEYCQSMNVDLRKLEVEFEYQPQLRHIIRGIILHNDLYINKMKKNPRDDS